MELSFTGSFQVVLFRNLEDHDISALEDLRGCLQVHLRDGRVELFSDSALVWNFIAFCFSGWTASEKGDRGDVS
jgi:hypothetical protein